MIRKSVLISSLVLAFALAGCGKKDDKGDAPAPAAKPADAPPAPTPAAPADPAAEAKKTFDTVCVACHGASGKGDGPGAAALDPKPRDYTDPEWQKATTDEQIAKIIVEGGAAVGKSPGMPPNPQFKAKPEVVAELVKLIRAFGPADAAGAEPAGDTPDEAKE